jgi:NADH dehydrogenase FAD-containing subunit
VNGSEAENVCYLRDIADANRLVNAIQSCPGGNAIVIGGGYVGMECAASLVINKINVTMVFPEAHCSKYFNFNFVVCQLKECMGSMFICINLYKNATCSFYG